jgi:hypothetical protein
LPPSPFCFLAENKKAARGCPGAAGKSGLSETQFT